MKAFCKILAAIALGALMFAEGDTFAASLAIKATSVVVFIVCGSVAFGGAKINGRA